MLMPSINAALAGIAGVVGRGGTEEEHVEHGASADLMTWSPGEVDHLLISYVYPCLGNEFHRNFPNFI